MSQFSDFSEIVDPSTFSRNPSKMSLKTKTSLVFLGVFVVIFGIGITLSAVYPMNKNKPWTLKYKSPTTGKVEEFTIQRPFYEIVRPDGSPSDKTFSIVWPILFALLSYAISTILTMESKKDMAYPLVLVIVQMALIFAWIPTFSHMHKPREAMYILIVCVMLGLHTSVYLENRVAGSIWGLYTGWLVYALMLNLKSVAKYDAFVQFVDKSTFVAPSMGPGIVINGGTTGGASLPPSGPGIVVGGGGGQDPAQQQQQIPLPNLN